jgi:hypothetical protein
MSNKPDVNTRRLEEVQTGVVDLLGFRQNLLDRLDHQDEAIARIESGLLRVAAILSGDVLRVHASPPNRERRGAETVRLVLGPQSKPPLEKPPN